MNYSKIRQGIADSLRRRLLRTPLWGVLDISQMERRYNIISVIEAFIFNDQFKADGFKLTLLDSNNFIQKLPYFHDELIEEHNLKFNGKPSYTTYLAYMFDQKEKNDKKNI